MNVIVEDGINRDGVYQGVIHPERPRKEIRPIDLCMSKEKELKNGTTIEVQINLSNVTPSKLQELFKEAETIFNSLIESN
ncbi:hypothetical protein COD67_01035 [Bacillus cereus]|nr:hypothetical protein COI89_00365 [Bacillus cereus]PGU70932.1 hypothetical protein COD67_01035 [Bacillus cereus]